jgi:transposase
MAHTYSIDLRKRILQDINAGMSPKAVAKKFSVSISWVYSFRKRYRETDSIRPKEYTPGRKKKLIPYEKEVCQTIAKQPDATLNELVVLLPKYVPVSNATLCEFLQYLKITRKKTLSAAEQHREEIAKEREDCEKIQETLFCANFVFIDET